MKTLSFYDLKRKKKFESSEYKISINKKGMRVAIATAPSGIKSYRMLGK